MVVRFWKFVKITGSTLVWLWVSDILGVVFVEETGAPYAVWFTAGLLCGFFIYYTAGNIAAGKQETGPANETRPTDWTNREHSGRIGRLVLRIVAGVLAALAVVFIVFDSGRNTGLVPERRPLTITFFVFVLVGSLLAHQNRRSARKQNALLPRDAPPAPHSTQGISENRRPARAVIGNFWKLAKITSSTLVYLFASFALCLGFVDNNIKYHTVVADMGRLDIDINAYYAAAYHAACFTFGLLCGLFSYKTGGNIAAGKPKAGSDANQMASIYWANREDSRRIGLLVLGVNTLVLVAFAVFFFKVLGVGTGSDNVPGGSRALAITFFVSVFAGSLFAHHSLADGSSISGDRLLRALASFTQPGLKPTVQPGPNSPPGSSENGKPPDENHRIRRQHQRHPDSISNREMGK